jgi:hypothetical protein
VHDVSVTFCLLGFGVSDFEVDDSDNDDYADRNKSIDASLSMMLGDARWRYIAQDDDDDDESDTLTDDERLFTDEKTAINQRMNWWVNEWVSATESGWYVGSYHNLIEFLHANDGIMMQCGLRLAC